MPDKLSLLSQHEFTNVLEYAIDGFTQELGPHQRRLPLKRLVDISLVSKSSYEMVSSIIKTFREEVGFIQLEGGGIVLQEDVEEIVGEFKEGGGRIRDFSLQWPESKEIDDLVIDWKQLFIHMPRLRRLDLSKIPILSRHLPNILLSASECCRDVEFLILPVKARDDFAMPIIGSQIDNVMTTLNAALECWYVQGNCGGLRQLTVVTRSEEDLFRSSTQYIEGVIQFCPNIEYLDGYNRILYFGDPDCGERWFINLQTWETFNATCTSLREFNWAVVPFADPYFEVFGKILKPQLQSLSLSANRNWNYLYFANRYTGPDEELPEEGFAGYISGYGSGVSNASSALKGCPALKQLHIEIDFELNSGSRGPYVNTEVCSVSRGEVPIVEHPAMQEPPCTEL